MPGYNGMGPKGMGNRTGRGMGNCVSFGRAIRNGFGTGFGRGICRNQGRGYIQGGNYLPGHGEDSDRYERYLEDELNTIREQKKNNR
ncbi:MAG: DUF5320 domain-containing protein [Syntrophomonas sp.]|nr:DUF5320 domain-containing protein [Syntrophomonas sp.]